MYYNEKRLSCILTFKTVNAWTFSEVRIEGTTTISEKESAHLKGKFNFHSSVKYLKWQKFHDGRFIDIDIHYPKYKGSSNDLKNPNLVIKNVNAEDEVDYRLEVETRRFPVYSNVWRLKVLHILGNFCSGKHFLFTSANDNNSFLKQNKWNLPWIISQLYWFNASLETAIEHDDRNEWPTVVTCYSL